MKYMNHPAKHGDAYCPTSVEHTANIITHGLVIIPSFYCFKHLLHSAVDSLQYVNAVLYGFSILFLFTTSTLYHSVFFVGKWRTFRHYLQLMDRAAIYLFIAASYSPWLTLKPTGSVGAHMKWVVWMLALTGIVYQYIFHEKYKLVETILYIFTGCFPSVAVLSMDEWSGVYLMALGGCVYICGVLFFKSDGKIPCAHAIWHLHVVIGASFHFYAVQAYLIGPKTNSIYPSDDHLQLAVKQI